MTNHRRKNRHANHRRCHNVNARLSNPIDHRTNPDRASMNRRGASKPCPSVRVRLLPHVRRLNHGRLNRVTEDVKPHPPRKTGVASEATKIMAIVVATTMAVTIAVKADPLKPLC